MTIDDNERIENAYRAYCAAPDHEPVRDIVPRMLEADDQWRREHPTVIDVTIEYPEGTCANIKHKQYPLKVKFTDCYAHNTTPSPSDAMYKTCPHTERYDGICTFCGNNKHDDPAASNAQTDGDSCMEDDEEPELPEGVIYKDHHYRDYSGGEWFLAACTSGMLEMVKKHAVWLERKHERERQAKAKVPEIDHRDIATPWTKEKNYAFLKLQVAFEDKAVAVSEFVEQAIAAAIAKMGAK